MTMKKHYPTGEYRDRITGLLMDGEWRTIRQIYTELRDIPNYIVSKTIQRMIRDCEVQQDRAEKNKYRYRLIDEEGTPPRKFIPPDVQPDQHPLSLTWRRAAQPAEMEA
jgi:hypothetical protein